MHGHTIFNIPIKLQTDIALVHQYFTSDAVLTLRCSAVTGPFVLVIFPLYTDVQ